MKDQITVTLSCSAAKQIIEHIRNEYELSGPMELAALPQIEAHIHQLEALHEIHKALMGVGYES